MVNISNIVYLLYSVSIIDSVKIICSVPVNLVYYMLSAKRLISTVCMNDKLVVSVMV